MSVFKCKMCGGDLVIDEGTSVAECEYCGTKQTVPNADNEKKMTLFARANRLRLSNEFDKAAGVYESIVAEFPEEAEAYWGLVLCRYGIEYVDDPATGKKIPTCHRSSFDSVMDDADFEQACENADAIARRVYRDEAKAIEEIRKGILEVSGKEEPYDIFICYKETADDGQRTVDSVIAQDVYDTLTEKGYRVFFSRISLEDKLGTEYEPYIFAALNSAKIMLAFGTDYEHYNAVWVKNEWSRFLKLMAADKTKHLIPCYKGIDAYDMPKEFARLQAQDMGKVGAMQDLMRGIEKILGTGNENTSTAAAQTIVQQVVTSGTNVDALLKRVFMFLEDGNWESADEYCEKVLDQNPENAQAYLGKLMAEIHVRRQDDLKNYEEAFDGDANYEKAYRFGDSALREKLSGYITFINDRITNEIYNESVQMMQEAKNEDEYRLAAKNFAMVEGFKDADVLAAQCIEKADICRKTEIYNEALRAMKSAKSEESYKAAAAIFMKVPDFENANALATQCLENAETSRKDVIYERAERTLNKNLVSSLEWTIQEFQKIPGWRDADSLIREYQSRIEEIKAKEEAERLETERRARELRLAAEKAAKMRRRILIITVVAAIIIVAFLFILKLFIIPSYKLHKAMEMIEVGDYDEAYALLAEIGNDDAIASSKYDRAMKLIDSGDYDEAYALLAEIGNDDAIASNKYDIAMKLIDSGDYKFAYMLLQDLAYKDSEEKADECMFLFQKDALVNVNVGDTIKFGFYEQDLVIGKEEIEWLVLNVEGSRALVISKYALDCQPYNTSYTDVTWEKCTLRKWLNDDFLNTAFSSKHRELISSVTVSADENPFYRNDPGNATNDRVFLLSVTEAEKYFPSDSARACKCTAYSYAQGAHKYKNGNCWWRLRSPGNRQNMSAGINENGNISYRGLNVDNDVVAVRPAMWIDLGQ